MPDFEEYYDIGEAEMLVRRPKLFLNEGDTSDFLVAAGAAMADKNDQYAHSLAAKTYVDTAEGDDLTTLADDHWGIQRVEANEATGDVTFTRATAGGGAGTIDAGTVVATDKDANGEDIRFVLDADVVFGGADLTKPGTATAEVAGKSGNVDASTINHIIDAIFDSSIVVSNAAAFAGGTEAESDPELRERIRAYPGTLRRGTLDALEYGAKTVPGVAVATAYEDEDTGITTVYVSDASGNSSAQMVTDTEEELENWRAACSLIEVQGGSLYEQAVTVSVTAKAGFDTAALATQIAAAITAALAKLGIGQTLYRTAIRTAVKNVSIDMIDEVTVTIPATDVAPASNQVIRAGTIAIS